MAQDVEQVFNKEKRVQETTPARTASQILGETTSKNSKRLLVTFL